MSCVGEQARMRDLGGHDPLEQRRWARAEGAGEVVIQRMKEGVVGEAMAAKSGDFSTMGLGLMCGCAMEKGEQFLVQLRTRAGAALSLLYAVVRCEAAGEGRHQVGAELVSVFNLDEAAKGRGGVGKAIAEGMGASGTMNDEG